MSVIVQSTSHIFKDNVGAIEVRIFCLPKDIRWFSLTAYVCSVPQLSKSICFLLRFVSGLGKMAGTYPNTPPPPSYDHLWSVVASHVCILRPVGITRNKFNALFLVILSCLYISEIKKGDGKKLLS